MKNIDHEEQEFSDFLAEFGHGVTNRTAAQRLREVVQACRETGKKGSVTIKIDVAVSGGLAEIKATVKASRPEGTLPGGMYFATDDGELATEDPRQTKLPLKVIDAPSKNLRTIPLNPKEG
jgi:hypothetical protein